MIGRWLLSIVLGVLATASICALASLPFLFKHYRLVSDGMAPSLTKGAHVFALQRPYEQISAVRRGDVVSWVKHEQGATYIMIWRVVGLPGDKLQFRDTSVLLNGKELEHVPLPSSGGLLFTERLGNAAYPVAYASSADRRSTQALVPPGYLFVVGDNRDHAFDSRFHGAIPFSSIVGKVVWPPGSLR